MYNVPVQLKLAVIHTCSVVLLKISHIIFAFIYKHVTFESKRLLYRDYNVLCELYLAAGIKIVQQYQENKLCESIHKT